MTAFNEALGLLEHDSGNLDVALGRLVECRGDDLGVDAAAHVGHLFGALVDEQHYDVCLGMILGNRVGNVLEQYRLTCFGRGHDQGTLALADGGEHVDHACRKIAAASACEVELLVGEEGHEVLERHAVADHFGRETVDRLDVAEGEILLARTWRPYAAFHHVAGLETELADLLLGDVDVIWTREVVVVARAEETESFGHHLEHAERG